jgi:hypothetical protein
LVAWLFAGDGLRRRVMPAAQAAETVAGEDKLKGAFLFNFTKFVEWPADAFLASVDPFVIGVVGDDSILPTLNAYVKGEKVGDRPIEVRKLADTDTLEGVQMVFVPSGKADDAAGWIKKAAGRAVLTVAESADDFAKNGGCLQFVRRDGKLRFVINLKAIADARLKASAKLASLAVETIR